MPRNQAVERLCIPLANTQEEIPRGLRILSASLERDGILTRTVHAAVPPRVDYALTPLGETLREAIGQLVSWADSHLPEIEEARAAYDGRGYDGRADETACPEQAAG